MATAESEPEVLDHREHADWVALSSKHGSNRRLHLVADHHDDLAPGDPVDVACATNLIGRETFWRAKPAAVFPPGYRELCGEPECFGAPE